MPRGGWLNQIGGLLIFLSIVAALVSNYLNAKVMGEAALGVAVFAPERGSPEWNRKVRLRRWADFLFYAGLAFATAGVLIQLEVWMLTAKLLETLGLAMQFGGTLFITLPIWGRPWAFDTAFGFTDQAGRWRWFVPTGVLIYLLGYIPIVLAIWR